MSSSPWAPANMKKFFQEIKADIKFKSAGPVRNPDSLGEKAPKVKPNQLALRQPRRGPTMRRRWRRLEQKQPRAQGPKSTGNQVREELRAQATVRGSPRHKALTRSLRPERRAQLTWRCWRELHLPAPRAALSRDQREAGIKEAILSVAVSIMKIHTFNQARDRVKLGVDSTAKYLDKLHLHPAEENTEDQAAAQAVPGAHHLRGGPHRCFEAIGSRRPCFQS